MDDPLGLDVSINHRGGEHPPPPPPPLYCCRQDQQETPVGSNLAQDEEYGVCVRESVNMDQSDDIHVRLRKSRLGRWGVWVGGGLFPCIAVPFRFFHTPKNN